MFLEHSVSHLDLLEVPLLVCRMGTLPSGYVTLSPISISPSFMSCAADVMQVGTMVSPNATLLVITAPGRELEALQRLARIGYNQVGEMHIRELKN